MMWFARTVSCLLLIGIICSGAFASADPLSDYFEQRYGVKTGEGILELKNQEKEVNIQTQRMIKPSDGLTFEKYTALREQIKKEIAEAVRLRDQKLSALGSDITPEQKQEIEREYQQRLAMIDLNLKSAIAKKNKETAEAVRLRDQKLSVLGSDITPEQKQEIEREYQQRLEEIESNLSSLIAAKEEEKDDSSELFTVRAISIQGNTLLSDDEILNLESLPIYFDNCDFKVVHELVIRPVGVGETGYKISQKTIQGLTKYILSLYEKKGYRGIYVYVAAESIEVSEGQEGRKVTRLKDDILTIDVLEASVFEVDVNYKKYDALMDRDPNISVPYRDLKEEEKPKLKPSLVKSWSPVQPGDVIHLKKLEDYTNLLNLNPDRYVSATVSKSQDPDKLNLDYNVFENNPWHFYIKSENSGTKETRWNPVFGVVNTNLLGMDDRFSAAFQGPVQKHPFDPTDENYSVYGSYDFPLFTPRLRLNLYGGYNDYERFTTGAGGVRFLGKGHFYGANLRFNLFQASLFQQDRWFFDLIGGIGHENSKSSYLTVDYDIDVDFWNAGAELYGFWDAKRLSSTSFSFLRSASMSASSRDEFQKARIESDPDFAIYKFSALHSQFSPTRLHRGVAKFSYVNSDERLIPANMTSFGGFYTVRGYKEYEIVADGGIQWSLQYEYDLVKHYELHQKLSDEELRRQQKSAWFSRVALLVFSDNGRAINKDPVAGEKEVQELASYGVGINATIKKNLEMGVYYGMPLRSTDETDDGKGRWNYSVILRF